MKQTELRTFVGKTILDLLETIREDYSSYAYFDHKPGLLAGCLFKFEDNTYLRVQINHYQFLKPFNPNRDWDIEEFKRETIADLTVEK